MGISGGVVKISPTRIDALSRILLDNENGKSLLTRA
jgi:hypothetical protein